MQAAARGGNADRPLVNEVKRIRPRGNMQVHRAMHRPTCNVPLEWPCKYTGSCLDPCAKYHLGGLAAARGLIGSSSRCCHIVKFRVLGRISCHMLLLLGLPWWSSAASGGQIVSCSWVQLDFTIPVPCPAHIVFCSMPLVGQMSCV